MKDNNMLDSSLKKISHLKRFFLYLFEIHGLEYTANKKFDPRAKKYQKV